MAEPDDAELAAVVRRAVRAVKAGVSMSSVVIKVDGQWVIVSVERSIRPALLDRLSDLAQERSG